MRLLIDMNLSPRWAAVLQRAGSDACHWSDIGEHNASMAHARANDSVVLTHDLDFGAILAATQGGKPSVVQIRADDVSPDVLGAQVVRALLQTAEELHQGALLTIDTHRTRLRLLPLQTRG